jgi:hypothetical protein
MDIRTADCSKMHTLVVCGDGQHATIQALSRTMRLRRGRISKLKPLGSAPLRGARTHALAPHNTMYMSVCQYRSANQIGT